MYATFLNINEIDSLMLAQSIKKTLFVTSSILHSAQSLFLEPFKDTSARNKGNL